MRIIPAVILFLLSQSLFASAENESDRELEKLHNQAVIDYRSENYNAALEKFNSGAMLAKDDFKIASFYYNAGNSAYMKSEKEVDIDASISDLETALKSYERCLEFTPEFDSAIHNGEMAMLELEKLKEQKLGVEKSSAMNELNELIDEQKNINKKASGENSDNNETASEQDNISGRSEELSQKYEFLKDDLLQASGMQKEAAELFRESEKEEGLDKQEQIIRLLEDTAQKMQGNNENNDSENDEALGKIIDQLEGEKDYEVIRQSGSSINDVEKDW